MTEYIYGDVLFVINFSMDFLALYISGKICRCKMKAWRLSLGAAIGAIYGVLSLVIDVPTAIGMIFEAVMAVVVCLVGLWRGGAGALIGATAAFYAASVTLGGAMTMIYSKLSKYKSYFYSGGSILSAIDDVPIWVFAICAALSFVISHMISSFEKRKSAISSCGARLELNGRKYELNCLIDSGALATEPISGTPVIFLSKKYSYITSDTTDGVIRRGVYAIPISSVGGEGIVFAIRPDSVKIETKSGYSERCALVAVGKEESYGGFDAIVPYSLL